MKKISGTQSLLPTVFATLLVAGCNSTQTASKVYSAEELGQVAGDTKLARDLNHQGLVAFESGKLQEAEALFQQALEADLTFGPARNNLGRLYFDRGAYYSAATEFEYAARLMPYAAEPRNNLGMVFERVGRLKDAEHHYEQAVEIQPENPVLLGNWLRSRVRIEGLNPSLKSDLEKLALLDERSDWRQWALKQMSHLEQR